MTKYFQYLFLFILIISCSSNEEKAVEKTYSNDTNQTFEMIERGGSYYLKKAPSNSIPRPEVPAPSYKKRPTNTKVDERLVEINQNLAFYCMKHRKDPAYGGDEAKCMKFVNKTMTTCQKKHRLVNSKLLSCIQTTLKNKR